MVYTFPPPPSSNQHTQGSDCHVSPHQRVFFCHVTASAFLSHVNRTSLAYWLGCSPSPCPPWLICIGFQVYNDVVRNDHDEPLASWRKTPVQRGAKTLTFNLKIAGTQEPTDICRVQIWFLDIFSIDHGECWMSESYFTQHKNSKTTTWKGFFWG